MENTVKEEKYAEKMLAEYSPEEKGNSDYETLKELDKKVNLLPKINAYVAVTGDKARDMAKASDARLAKGEGGAHTH